MVSAVGFYNSQVDFRISSSPPNLGPENQASILELYAFANAVIQAFINNCGIDSQQTSLWGQLAGNPVTLLSGNLNRIYLIAGEDILGYNAINLYSPDGVNLYVRNANATAAGRQCDGFLNYSDGVTAGNVCEVLLHSGVTQYNGLVPGTRYYLSTTNGLVAPYGATAAGNVEQYVGIAIDATNLAFSTHYWIQH